MTLKPNGACLAMAVVVQVSLIVPCIWTVVHGHARLIFPEPRSSNTAIKNGPCGFDTNVFEKSRAMEVAPGTLLISFEESISHRGAPFRFSLSEDGSDDSSCIILDHVPHNDVRSAARPRIEDESTYISYFINLEIPDVACDQCSLHLANPMTDKIGGAGAPDGIGCTVSVTRSGVQGDLLYELTGSRNLFLCVSFLQCASPNNWVSTTRRVHLPHS